MSKRPKDGRQPSALAPLRLTKRLIGPRHLGNSTRFSPLRRRSTGVFWYSGILVGQTAERLRRSAYPSAALVPSALTGILKGGQTP